MSMSKRISILAGILLFVLTICLLMPRVTYVREAANRIACQNNLKQLGNALANYHDANGSFPAATVPSNTLPFEKRLSWLYDLDPYMISRMSPRHSQDRTKAWDAPENQQIVSEGLPYYLCPSNPDRGDAAALPLTHYVGIAGLGEDAAGLTREDGRAGVFGYDRRTRREDIRDGTSLTLMVMETTLNNGCWAAGGPATVRGLDTSSQPYLGKGGQFGGSHPGHTVATFADGSAHTMHDTVSPEVIKALMTIAGGEQVEEPWVADLP